MSSRTVVVDDSDTDAIKYIAAAQSGSSQGGGWSPYTGASLNENFEGPIHNSTLHAATFTGTSLEFSFSGASATFSRTQNVSTDPSVCRCLCERELEGTRVAVYGSVWPPSTTYAPLTVSEYIVVGAGSTTNISTGSFQAPNFTIPKNNLNLFTSNDMPYGAYVLTVNVTRASIDSPYYLDYFAVLVPDSAPTSVSTSASAAPVSGSSAEAASTSPPMPVSSLSNHASLPIGAIVGVAMAAAVFIAIVVAIAAYRCARRRRGPPEYQYEFVGEQDEGMTTEGIMHYVAAVLILIFPEPPPLVTPFMMPELVYAMREAAHHDAPSMVRPPYATPPPSPAPSALPPRHPPDAASFSTAMPDSISRGHVNPRGGEQGVRSEGAASNTACGEGLHEGDEAPPAYTPC